jgi:hypothetical protein
MSGGYKARGEDWAEQENWEPDDGYARCLLELRSRVELLEATQHAHLDASQLSEAEREAMTEPGKVEALEKVIRVITGSLTPAEQTELGVVSVKDLQADLRSIAFEAMKAAQEAMTEPGKVVTDQPEPAPLATDQDLYQLYDSTGPTVVDAFRAIYDLGRQDGAAQPAPAAEGSVAPLLWVLWHHLGSSSPVGQPIREYLGMGRFQPMSEEQVEAAKGWSPAQPEPPAAQPEPPTFQESQAKKAHYEAELARLKCEAMHQPAKPAPDAPAVKDSLTAAPAGSLVEGVGKARANARVLGYDEDRAAICVIAAWLRVESKGHLGSGAHWAHRMEQEADR